VYYEPIEEISKGAYSMLIQKLILDIIANEYKSTGEKCILISKSKLAKMLGLIKSEYKDYFPTKKRNVLSEVLDIDIKIIDEFYMMTESKLRGYIETALNSLSQKSIINYSNDTLIIKGKEYFSGIRVADDREISLILKAENAILESLMSDSDRLKTDIIKRRDTFVRGQWDEFTTKTNDLLESFGMEYVDFYFRGYKINFSEDIINAKERMDRFISNNRVEIKNELNTLFSDRYKESYQRFHDKALSSYSDELLLIEDLPYSIKKIIMRADCNYVYNGHTLINSTIDKQSIISDFIVEIEDTEEIGIPF